MEKKRDNFGSSFGVLVALVGSAVGLGNIWRFPYLVGQNGGAAFIVIYLACIFIISLPIMFCEFTIGRRSQTNAVDAFKVLAPGSKWWITGVLGITAAFLILSFYSVVGGWCVNYLTKACTFQFNAEDTATFHDMFSNLTTGVAEPIIYHFIFLALTAAVVILGVKNGIEKFSKIMMPVLFLIIVLIAISSIIMDKTGEGIRYLFKPDFSKVTGQVLISAMGQAFFSLSLGMGGIITYASYASKSENIFKLSTLTAVSDTIFAIIAGCAILPAVFTFGLSPNEGPGLVFETLPFIFAQYEFGNIIAIFFFVALFLAALTSSISLLEVVTAYVSDSMRIKRWTAVTAVFILLFILGAACSLSLGPWSHVKIFGMGIFDLFDFVSANVLMTVGALLIVLFVGWQLKKATFIDEMTNGGSLRIPRALMEIIFFLIKYFVPAVIVLIICSKFL